MHTILFAITWTYKSFTNDYYYNYYYCKHFFILFYLCSASPQGKYPTSGMKVDAVDTPVRNDEEQGGENDEEEEEHKFFVTGSLMERRLLAICSTKKEQTQWTEGLADQAKHGPVYIPTKPQSLQVRISERRKYDKERNGWWVEFGLTTTLGL